MSQHLIKRQHFKKKLKVGIIGTGAIGNIHAESYLANSSEVEIVALCDTHPEKLSNCSKRFGVRQVFNDYRDLLRCDLDAVSICVGNALHFETTIQVLKAGKHVLLEKPMALHAQEAQAMVHASKKHRKILQLAMVYRQNREVQWVQRIIREGALGKVYHIDIRQRRRRGIPGLGGWFTTQKLSGGGPLIDIGVHYLDVAMYVNQLWNPTAVSAQTYRHFGSPIKNYKYVSMWAGPPQLQGTFDVEDSAMGLIRFSNTTTLKFEIAWAGNTDDETSIDILGHHGGVRLFDGKPVRLFTESNGAITDIHPKLSTDQNMYHEQAHSFIQACLHGTPPAAKGEEGVILMKVIDGIYKSSKLNKEVLL